MQDLHQKEALFFFQHMQAVTGMQPERAHGINGNCFGWSSWREDNRSSHLVNSSVPHFSTHHVRTHFLKAGAHASRVSAAVSRRSPSLKLTLGLR
jgi:hypothetical protein